jgi:PAS domain S-box-containing protein
MSLVDIEGRVVYANRAFSRMFGHTLAECIGLRAANLVESRFAETTESQLSQLMRGEAQRYRTERRYRRRDGSLFRGLVSASAVRANGNGRPARVADHSTRSVFPASCLRWYSPAPRRQLDILL